MSLLLNLIRARRAARSVDTPVGQDPQNSMTRRGLLARHAGAMPFMMGAQMLRSNPLSPGEQAGTGANQQAALLARASARYEGNAQANLPANMQANLQANTPARLQANAPANMQANAPKSLQANAPANVQANAPKKLRPEAPANTPANMPANTQANAPSLAPDERTITVGPGDTLSAIALAQLGKASRWPEIFAMNRDTISNPNQIHPGQVLRLPLAGMNNVPANTPANLPNNQPALADEPDEPMEQDEKSIDENVEQQTKKLIGGLTGVFGVKAPMTPEMGDNAGAGRAAAQRQLPNLGPLSRQPSNARANALAEMARQELRRSNPSFAATAKGQHLVELFGNLIANSFAMQPVEPVAQPQNSPGATGLSATLSAAQRNYDRKRRQRTMLANQQQQMNQANQQVQAFQQQQQNQQQTEAPTHEQGLVPGTSAYQVAYERHLKKGIDILFGARLSFGRADNQAKGHFDARYWAVKADPQYGARLEHKGNGKPHEAIDEMFANVGKWSMDCAEFVQASQLYAQRHALGADGFDAKFASRKLAFRVHGSTGVDTEALYHQESPGARPVVVTVQGKRPINETMDDVLEAAPVGSRVMFTNPYAPTTSAWLNENSVKLGRDSFAAHPMGMVSRKTLEAKLHNINSPTKNKASRVFLRQVEIYRNK